MAFKWPKFCTNCGRSIKEQSWQRLKCIGVMHGDKNNPDNKPLELRNCACGSTLAVPTSASSGKTG